MQDCYWLIENKFLFNIQKEIYFSFSVAFYKKAVYYDNCNWFFIS